jgi:hypothetical protein
MMTETKLLTVEHLVDELGIAERVRLLQYLAPRIAEALAAKPASAPDAAWQLFREVGAELAAGSVAGESMTQAVSDMRR